MTGTKGVIRTYVRHGDDMFLVSTIERDSSSVLGAGGRYNETFVWESDDDFGMNRILHQTESARGDISAHLALCKELHDTGTINTEDDV